MAGIELGAAYLSIIPETSKLAPEIRKAMGDAGADAAKSAGKKTGSGFAGAIGGALTKGLKLTAAGAIAGLGVTLAKGFSRLNALDQATAKLSGLGHSAETVQKIMDDALAAVKGTAFGMDEAATSAASMVAAGIKPGKDLERTLTLIGDAATIAGTDMASMGAIFGKVATSGKVQGDVINQLGDRGIPIMQLLADQMGVTTDAVSEMSRKGQIDFDTFRDAIESGMGGAALKSGDTFQGALKNAWAAVGRIGANLLSGVFPQLTGGLGTVTDWLGTLEEKAKVVGEDLGKWLGKAAEGAGVFIGAFTGSGDKVPKHLQGVADVAETLRSVFDAVAPAVQNVFGMFASYAKGQGKNVGKLFEGLMANVEPMAEAFRTDLLPVLKQFGGFLMSTGKTLIPIVLKIVNKVVDSIISFAPTAMDWIKTLMGVVKAALPVIMQVVTTVVNTIKEQLPVIMPIIDQLVTAIKDFMAILLARVRAGVDMFMRIWKAIAPVVLPMIKSMIRGIVSIIGGIVKVISGIMTTVRGIMEGDFSKVKDGLKSIFQGIVQVIKAPITAVRDWLSEVFGKFKPMIKEKMDAAVTAFKTAWDTLKQKAGQPIKFIIETVVNKGLLGAFNFVAGKLKAPTIPLATVPAGLARGGILPGYTPMARGDDQLRPMRSGEGVLVSEGLRDPRSRNMFLQANAAARRGVSFADFLGGGFAYGGIVPGPGNRHTSGYPWATWAGDFPNPMGTPVKSWKDGLIAAVRYLTTSYGQHIRINHDDGSSSLYAHLSKILVAVGDRVTAGQHIGNVGSTGNSSGPHLHFEALGAPFKPAGVGGDFTNNEAGFDPLGALADKFAPALAELKNVGGGVIGKIASEAPKKLKGLLTDKVKNFASEMAGKVAGTVGTARWSVTATEALMRAGQFSPGNLASLLRRMNQESGGNARAINNWDSNAANGTPSKGLMQVIDPTFAAYRDPGLKNDIWDPLANISASIRYALARYGSLKAAYDRQGGYANGTTNAAPGLHWVGENGPELMAFRGGETVIPNRQSMQIAGLSQWMSGSGREVVAGLILGMDRNRAAAEKAATQLAYGTAQAARDELGIASPSKVFTTVGRWVSEGLAKGIRGTADKVVATVKTLRTNMEKVWTDQNRRRKSALVERWSDEVKRLRPLTQARSKLVNQIAATEKKIQTARDAKTPNKKRISTLQAELLGLRSALSGKDYSKALKNAEKRLAAARKIDPNRGVAKSWAAFSKQIRTQTRLLRVNARQRTKMAEQLKKAEASLLDARRTRNDYRRDVRGSAVDAASVVGQSKFSQSLIAEKLRGTLKSWKAFGLNLKRLRRMGLADQAYQEIVNAGPDEGGAIAKVLLQSGKRGIAEINSLQKQIRKAGDTVGRTASNELYQSGVEAAAGLVQGLRSKQKELDKVGVSLAKSLVRAVKKELKIKSPSRVMFEAGAFTAEGFALGMGAEEKKVLDASSRLADAAVPALAGFPSAGGSGWPNGQRVSIEVIDRDGTYIERMDGRIKLHERQQSIGMRSRR